MQVDLGPAQGIHSRDPGAIQAMLDALTEGLLGEIANPLLAAGEQIWLGLATVVVVWTGVRIALSGGAFSGWDIVRLVTALMVPRTILFYYATPLPAGGQTLPEAISGMGDWIAAQVLQDTYSATWAWLGNFLSLAFAQVIAAGMSLGIFSLLDLGGAVVELVGGLVVAVLAIFMGFVSLLLVVISFAQVIWAKFAVALLIALGPVFVPFLLFEPLAFLFWGWFRSLLTYSLYAAVAACVVRVFLAAVRAASNGMWDAITPDLTAIGGGVMWLASYFALAVAGLLAVFKIPDLASGLVSGSAGGGGMLGALASAATAGHAAVASGKAALRGRA